MTLSELVLTVLNKRNFDSIPAYIQFCKRFLDFALSGLQATIVSQNENHYQFFQSLRPSK